MVDALVEKINRLRKAKKAVILAHNYTRGEVQDVADFVGDSLELSQKAASTEADIICFCGVRFMAETAKILSPEKKVIMPDENAGCPLANMITSRELQKLKKEHPGAAVVCYVNTTAEIKAMCDVCCTSSNAVKVVNSIAEDRQVIFIPDASLGDYTSKKTGRKMILYAGYCPTHHRILAGDIHKMKKLYPDAKVVVHPECLAEVVELADAVTSTSGILRYCRETDAKTFIIGTELGILHRLRKENPGKEFHAASPLSDCPNMKLTTLEKIVWCLEDEKPEITLDPEIIKKARHSIQRMLDHS